MNTNNDRVLGRILAIEEIHDVSGAKPTSPSRDNLTFPPTDTGEWQDIIPMDIPYSAM